MRPLVLSIGTLVLALGAAWAQTPGGRLTPQIPFGQTFKDFHFPYYENGQLKVMLSAVSAKGTTINRAEATELKIDLYDDGKITTTVTSPKADLYIAEQRMRTKNTVLIERADMEASAQSCDFDLPNKRYQLHENVKVVLKSFDATFKTPTPGGEAPAAAPAAAPSSPAPRPRESAPVIPPLSLVPSPSLPAHNSGSLLDTPGAYANTNTAPANPPANVNP